MSAKLVLFSSSVFLPLVTLLLAAMTPPAQAATAGELLEKAIYAEETVGNLEEAIKLYEQVIAEGKSAKSAAAKAQFRLGVIYEKQGKAAQATAAFQAVVDSYPDEQDLVAQARKKLPSEVELLPVPWVDGEELQLDVKLATGIDIGTMIYRIESATHEGKDVWQCTTRGLITASAANSVSRVICEKESFKPIKSFWKHSMLGEAVAEYSDDGVTIRVVGKDKPFTLKTSPLVFDNEQCMELFRRLPLKPGYKTELSVVSSLGAGEIKLKLEAPGAETIETPAGKFDCQKLELNIGQTFWISDDEHRYVARFSAGGVTADLTRVEVRKSDQGQDLSVEGLSLAVPAGWRVYAPKSGLGGDQKQMIFLLDPDAVADAHVTVGPLDTLNDEERKSAKAWTELAMEKIGKAAKDFKVREPGVQELKLGERTAATVIADYMDDGQGKTIYGVAVFSDDRAFNLRFTTPTDKLDELKPQFDAIVSKLKVQ